MTNGSDAPCFFFQKTLMLFTPGIGAQPHLYSWGRGGEWGGLSTPTGVHWRASWIVYLCRHASKMWLL